MPDETPLTIDEQIAAELYAQAEALQAASEREASLLDHAYRTGTVERLLADMQAQAQSAVQAIEDRLKQERDGDNKPIEPGPGAGGVGEVTH